MYKVLVVEDEDIIRKGLLYTVKWEEMDCMAVGEARNGVEGIKQIEKLRPDIVIVDINMPVMTGLEMLEKTWKQYQYTAIILSGYAEFEYAQKAITYGVVGYLLKPLKREELKENVELAIERCKNLRHLAVNEQEKGSLGSLQIIEALTKEQQEDEIVGKMLQYIQQHFSEKVTLGDIVEEMNYSETFLNNKFKKKMGTTFIEYLNRYRVQKAIEMLQKDEEDIQEIAWKCGIGEYKYFNTVFKKYVGYSPKEFRFRLHDNGKNENNT